jgi:act minimal PKS acyl carrier protein
MSEFTMDDLRRVMQEAAGENRHLEGDVLDQPFTELGYDSLALLEAAARVERSLGIQIGDDDIAGVGTPRDFIQLVNDRLAQASV